MASFAGSQPDPDVRSVPFFASGTIANATNVAITFDNVTESVQVVCTSTGDAAHALYFGVTTGGVEGTARLALASGKDTGKIEGKFKQVVLRGGGSTCGYQVLAVLSREASADYPDITTANGFAGV